MEVDVGMAPRATYHGQTYFFCMEDHKKLFAANPERVLSLDRQADTNLCV
jgi:YHS domain-containing protein